jgi:hypothetical protein
MSQWEVVVLFVVAILILIVLSLMDMGLSLVATAVLFWLLDVVVNAVFVSLVTVGLCYRLGHIWSRSRSSVYAYEH